MDSGHGVHVLYSTLLQSILLELSAIITIARTLSKQYSSVDVVFSHFFPYCCSERISTQTNEAIAKWNEQIE